MAAKKWGNVNKKFTVSKEAELVRAAILSIGVAHENLIELAELQEKSKSLPEVLDAEAHLVEALNVLDQLDKRIFTK